MPHIRIGDIDTRLIDAIPDPSLRNDVEKIILEEYLNEDPDMNDTIANLTQLLSRLETMPNDTVSADTLLNIRRALHSLTILHNLVVS